MKNFLILITLFICLGINAQETETTNPDLPDYSADKLTLNEEDNIILLEGNVNFKTTFLELENAEKLLWNRNTHEILVTGLKTFTVDGSVVLSEKVDKKILKYKIGDRVAYLE